MSELTCKDAGRLGGLKGGLSRSLAKLAGLAKARATRLSNIQARKNKEQSVSRESK